MLQKSLIGAAAVLAIVSLAGCSGSGNNDPSSRVIGPEGGLLSKALGVGTATVSIPAGAVTTPTKFTLLAAESSTIPPDPAPDKPVLRSTAVRLQPDTTFNQPVTITLPYSKPIPAGKDDSSLLICQATAGNGWARINTTDSAINATNQTATDTITNTNQTRPYAILAIK
jgi:hypothetical protein